jgi:hypothetical protein
MISKPKDTVKNKRIAKKKKQLTYTSLGKGQTMMALHNLGKSSNKIASKSSWLQCVDYVYIKGVYTCIYL